MLVCYFWSTLTRVDQILVRRDTYNVVSYILANDKPIQDGETIDGVANGQMYRETQWKCQYEESPIQPPRPVIGIHTGNRH